MVGRSALVVALLLCATSASAEIRAELDVSTRQSPPVATPVTMEIDDAPSPLVLVFSNWLPGAYELRWFGRDVSGLGATADRPLTVERVGPDRFVVRGHDAGAHVRVSYRVTAALMSDDGAEISAAHVYFNPAAVLPRVLGLDAAPYRVGLHGLPSTWRRACSLGDEAPYTAPSWSALADALFEAAPPETLALATSTIEGARFTIAVDRELLHGGEARVDPQLEVDVAKLVKAEVALAGPFPQPRFLVLVHETDRPGHAVGLEHAQATSILVPATNPDENEARGELRHMLAHELFHAWNARRIVPTELVAWDPERPQASRDLWISEGLTEYAAVVARVRAGMLDPAGASDALSELLTRTRRAAVGLSLEALSQLAFAAPHALASDEDAYYAAGASVSLALTAELLKRTHGKRDLSDVLHAILPPIDEPPRAIDRVRLGHALDSLSPKLGALLDRLVTQPLSFAAIAEPLHAAHLSWRVDPARADAGVLFDDETLVIDAVEPGGAFARAGLLAGDRVLTVDGVPVTRTILEQLARSPRRSLIGAARASAPMHMWVEPAQELGAIVLDPSSIDLRARLLYGPR